MGNLSSITQGLPYNPNKTSSDNLDNLIKNTIHNLVKKQIYKKQLITKEDTKQTYHIYKYLDLKKINQYQYNEYYLPVDKTKNEYAKLNKKEYYLCLFRLVEQYVPSVNINNVLYSLYLNKSDSFTSLNTQIYHSNKFVDNKYCNIEIKILLDSNNNYKFGIVIPNTEDILQNKDFENYFFNLDTSSNANTKINNYNKYINILSKNKIRYSYIAGTTVPEYMSNFYYTENSSSDDENFIILAIILYYIKNCNSDYIFSNLILDYTEKSTPTPSTYSHRNKLFIQKIYDMFNNLNNVKFFHYEPHGYGSGFSYSTMNIDYIYNMFTNKIISLKKNSFFNPFLVNFDFDSKGAVCLRGPQSISAKEDIGYCTVFSTFWFNCFINILDNINTFDKLQKSNIKVLNYFKKLLSNMPIQDWIGKIDETITNLSTDFKVEYPTSQYNIEKVIKTMKYFIINDYTDNIITDKFFINSVIQNKIINYGINTNNFNIGELHELYYEYIKEEILRNYKSTNPKISIEEFFNLYEKVLETNKVSTDNINKIMSLKYNLRNVGYFNVFVEFAYKLFDLSYTNNYFTENDKKLLNQFTIDPLFYDFIRRSFSNKIVKDKNLLVHRFSKMSDINDYNKHINRIKELEDETKEYEFAQTTGLDVTKTRLEKRYMNIESDIRYFLGEGDMKKGQLEFDEMMNEKEEESKMINDKVCKSSKECENIDLDLTCKNQSCVPKKDKQLISTNCKTNSDCLSRYCKKYDVEVTNPTTGLRDKNTFGYCRKKD